MQFLRGQFLTKKLSDQEGISRIILWKLLFLANCIVQNKQLSSRDRIRYENRFLVMYSLISHETTECKNNSYVHSNKSHLTLNESVWTEINCSQWYEIKLMWNRNRAYLQPKNCFMNCLRTYIVQSRICPGKKKPMKYDVVRTII